MSGTYDFQLVGLSLMVAIIASYTALELAGRVSQGQGKSSGIWLVGGAISLGTGIWAMHFIGMLAFQLPVPMAYDIGFTMLSMAIAVLLSGLALFVLRRQALTWLNITSGAVLMGSGISAMHYTGMHAMRMAPPIEYQPSLFIASVIIAFLASLVALRIASHLRSQAFGSALPAKLGSATIMGLAITGMHYTGMAAARFAPDSICTAIDSTGGMKSDVLALAIGITSICILAITLGLSALEPTRSIRWKLAGAFISVACFVAAFVGLAIAVNFQAIERAAQREAEHVAELIADAAVENNTFAPDLQDYITRLNSLHKRDVVIVDAAKKGLADADPAEVGATFTHDAGNEVGKTIIDGQTRTFVEKNDHHPDGAYQLVVPVRQRGSVVGKAPIGAVVLEYTSIREELLTAELDLMYMVSAAGAVAVLLVTLFGLGIARRIARPLGNLKNSAERVAAQDYAARVEITSRDEIGLLGLAFNKMAQDLSVSHAELVAHKSELENRVAERTRELGDANKLLQQEVREHQLATERAEYLTYHDSLTALPNRSMFSKLLNQAISLARREGRQVAVLFIDLDRFKNINDTLGHDVGDGLLRELGKRLQDCLRDSDTVARLGGDEFVILLPLLQDAAQVEVVARKILAAASKSFTALGQEFHVTASVGVSTFPQDGEDEQSLMKNADIAMYKAKEDGKNNFQLYSAQLNKNTFERLALESSLRRALENGEFELHYQPKIDARSGSIAGIEALLRWQHPELGMVPPAKFIPIAEETGLIVSIGKWVLRTACAQNMAWQQRGLPHLNIAVNLSGRQFSDESLLADVTSILQETGMNSTLLELEITESTLMHDVDKAILTLKAFRDMGVRLALDDFGTGYSSLSTLRQFPVDTIKIDGSFIRDLSTQPENRGLARAIIAMGNTLSMTVVAEGVETKAQADFLREQACDEFQGFYFSKAVPAGKFAALLETQTSPMPAPARPKEDAY